MQVTNRKYNFDVKIKKNICWPTKLCIAIVHLMNSLVNKMK